MVLYCTVHGGCILRALIHKFKYHDEEEAVFIVDKDPDSLYCPKIDKITYYQMPEPYGIFEDGAPVEKIKEETNKALSAFFKEIKLDPLQFSDVYAMFDYYNPFTLYFEINSIKYMLIEFGRSQLYFYATDPTAMKTNEKFRDVVSELHLKDACGKNCIKAFLHDRESVRDVVRDHVDTDVYDFYENLINIDDRHKRQLIECYHIAQYDFDAVMLLNSISVSKSSVEKFRSGMPYKHIEENPHGAFYSFYKTIFDYYFYDVDFALKLHPESDENFRNAFSEFVQLPREVPMEAFSLLGKKFDIFCPANSTTLYFYRELNYNIVNFELNIFNFVKQVHFIFLAFTLINIICPPPKIFVRGIEPRQLEIFKNRAYKDFKDVEFERLGRDNIKNAIFVVADDPTADFMDMIKGAPRDCLIILNGSHRVDESIFAKQEMIYSIIDVSEEDEEELRKCCWTVMSKNREFLDVLRDFSASYMLEKSKMKIQSLPHN